MLRDYTPEVGIDLHEGDNEDLPILSARHLNVFEPLFSEGKLGLVEGWMYEHAADSGWWHGPYSTGGDSHEGILRNTFALKNALGMLAREPRGRRSDPARRGHEPRQPQPQVVREPLRGVHDARVLLDAPCASCTTSCRIRSRSTPRTSGPS